MRRILTGTVLFCWISILVSLAVTGFGTSETRIGLLTMMQLSLTEGPFLALSTDTARGIVTGAVVVTLSAILWSLMIAITSAASDFRERIVCMGSGFACTFALCTIWSVIAAMADNGALLATIAALQALTLLTMLAAGGIEFAWEARLPAASEDMTGEADARLAARQMALTSAKLAAIVPGAQQVVRT
jgi:hypothetical protein